MKRNLALAFAICFAGSALANSTYHSLSGGSFSQNWSNTGLITANDDWSGVLSVEGFLGDDASGTVTNVDPQTLLGFGTGTIDVIANQTNPNTLATGGVAEFDTLADPVVALNGSGTADFPFLMFYVDATNVTSVNIRYNLRDIDGSVDNSVQQVALQYRIGNAGNFTNLPAGYVADASSGPSLATLVTPVSVTLPNAVDGQAQVQIRVMTTNAGGNDEWIGVDDIVISANVVPEPASMAALLIGAGALIRRRKRS